MDGCNVAGESWLARVHPGINGSLWSDGLFGQSTNTRIRNSDGARRTNESGDPTRVAPRHVPRRDWPGFWFVCRLRIDSSRWIPALWSKSEGPGNFYRRDFTARVCRVCGLLFPGATRVENQPSHSAADRMEGFR